MSDIMGSLRRTNMSGELREEHIGEEVVLMGWVQRERNLGPIIFVDLRDTTGISQIVFDDSIEEEVFEKAKTLRSEYVVAIKGLVRERESINEDIPTGKVEVLASELKILNKAKTPEIYIKDEDNVSDDMKLKYRFLDLRKPSMQNRLRTRSKIAKVTRDFFDENRFVEVETPILGKPTPEGARDYLVPSRVNAGEFYALPQSPQLMKQLLMVSGLDRYYQIAKCFRDEDLRANRQPEFTQIDVEMSFVDVEDVLEMNERYIQKLYKEIKGIDIELPIKRMTYNEAMSKYGVDKPDLRFGNEIVDLSDIVENSEFGVFSNTIKNGGKVQGIRFENAEKEFSNKDIKRLEKFVKDFGAMGIVDFRIIEGQVESGIAKFLSDEEKDQILNRFEAKDGDIIFIIAADLSIVQSSLGNLRLEVAKKLDIIPKDRNELVWIVEFPLFEYDDEEDRLVAVHHPFTSPMDEDIELMDTDPLKVRAKAYDIVINGEEMGGGSIRISNPELQNKMFEKLGFSNEQIEDKFGFLIDAFKYGVPPHGGIAYGLDRLVMTMTGTENIRDVIAFPKTQSATCLLTGAPIALDKEQLKEVHIKVDLSKDE